MIEALPVHVLTMIVLKETVSQAKQQTWAAIFCRGMS